MVDDGAFSAPRRAVFGRLWAIEGPGKVRAVNETGPITSPRAGARTLALALLAAFWVAQLSGLAHAVSHLGSSRGMDGLAPHALVCTGCIAAADSGAAPVLAAPAGAPKAPSSAAPAARLPVSAGREAFADYRSRAPPAAPI
jgi:hypothetical protein